MERTRRQRSWIKWSLIFLGWNLVAWLFVAQYAYQAAYVGRPFHLGRAFFQQAIGFYIWFALTPLILWLSRRYPFERRNWLRSVLVHVVASLVLSQLQLLLELGVVFASPFFSWAGNRKFFDVYKQQVVYFSQFNLFCYWVTLGIAYAVSYYRMYRERELRASQLEARLAQSQLEVLKMQLHPHFLFNTLHTISSTMHRDVEAADDMITHLSDLLRITLENVGVQEVSLRQELGLLERYLEIEKARFRERLEVRLQIDPGTLDARVPNLLLQPLVENAIRHGISVYSTIGTIDINSRREDGMLRLEVRDNGPGLPVGEPVTFKEGVGLSNTKARLQQLYGEKHHFKLYNSTHGGLVVDIAIPFQANEANADDAS